MTARSPTPDLSSFNIRPAGLLRRLAALVYDALLIGALLILATAPLLLFTGGQGVQPENRVYPFYLITLVFVFYGWFWTHGGQTLGMRAWHIITLNADRHILTWRQALMRFVAVSLPLVALGPGALWLFQEPKMAIFALACSWLTNYLWIGVDQHGRALHDRLSNTQIIHIPKPKKPR